MDIFPILTLRKPAANKKQGNPQILSTRRNPNETNLEQYSKRIESYMYERSSLSKRTTPESMRYQKHSNVNRKSQHQLQHRVAEDERPLLKQTHEETGAYTQGKTQQYGEWLCGRTTVARTVLQVNMLFALLTIESQ